MNEEDLQDVISTLRTRLERDLPGDLPDRSRCLTFERARAIALNRAVATAAEEEHRERCPRCSALIRQFEEALPHLPLWLLIRHRWGALRPSEAELLRYHLEDGGCVLCRQRARRAEALVPSAARLIGPFSLPSTRVVGAATALPETTVVSADGHLEAELLRTGDGLRLELRTRDEALEWSAVGFAARSAAGSELTGFLLLTPDVEGWFTAETDLGLGAVPSSPGEYAEVMVYPVDLASLSPDERAELAGHGPFPEAARRRWLARAEQHGDPLVLLGFLDRLHEGDAP